MNLHTLEELVNKEIVEGRFPTSCRLHPTTMALILEDFHKTNNSLREAVADGKSVGVVQLDDTRTSIQNMLHFVEDETIPEGEVRLV